MPYEVSQLLKDLGDPVTADPEEPIQHALDRMLDNKFSQLPVVKGSGQFYFITHESILLALHSFGSRIESSGLRVDDALVKIPTVYSATDDLFELLAGLREMNAALIVDEHRDLTHVVTSYDTARYFRQWAEDTMQVRDVEYSLRRIISSAFKKADGEIDEQARQVAVEEIVSSNRALRKKFVVALRRYITQRAATNVTPMPTLADRAFLRLLGRASAVAAPDVSFPSIVPDPDNTHPGVAGEHSSANNLLAAGQILRERFQAAIEDYLTEQASSDVQLDEAMVEDAFKLIYDRNEQSKEFGKLTLAEYIQLFFKEECWGRCQSVIQLSQEEVNHMLEGVRETRNLLAHFREEEITAQRRFQLRTCADWLSAREGLILSAFEKTAPSAESVSEVPEPNEAKSSREDDSQPLQSQCD